MFILIIRAILAFTAPTQSAEWRDESAHVACYVHFGDSLCSDQTDPHTKGLL